MPQEKIFRERVERLDRLFVLDQPKLRELAFALKRLDGSLTLNVTALVNEAYIKLREGAPDLESQLHLRRMAGQAMRHILADAARARGAQKRGGDGSIQFVCAADSAELLLTNDRELLALDDALTELEAANWRQKEIVECYFFAGLSWREIAGYMGISLATVEREWRVTRVWLKQQMSGSQ